LRRRLQCLGTILQAEAIIALIYHWEESSSIWGSSSSGGTNPWSPLSSASRTSSLRVRLNPSFCIGAIIFYCNLWEAYFVSPGAFCVQLILLS
jgi:hypothetical protein